MVLFRRPRRKRAAFASSVQSKRTASSLKSLCEISYSGWWIVGRCLDLMVSGQENMNKHGRIHEDAQRACLDYNAIFSQFYGIFLRKIWPNIWSAPLFTWWHPPPIGNFRPRIRISAAVGHVTSFSRVAELKRVLYRRDFFFSYVVTLFFPFYKQATSLIFDNFFSY